MSAPHVRVRTLRPNLENSNDSAVIGDLQRLHFLSASGTQLKRSKLGCNEGVWCIIPLWNWSHALVCGAYLMDFLWVVIGAAVCTLRFNAYVSLVTLVSSLSHALSTLFTCFCPSYCDAPWRVEAIFKLTNLCTESPPTQPSIIALM